MSTDRIRQAVAAQRRGWAITPLRGKVPILAGWQALDCADEADATKWARAGNYGIRCGDASGGLVVLDEDRSGALGELLGEIPRTPTVVTGAGGRHYYFRHTGEHIGNSVSSLAPGLDVRGEGGQVVGPGSIHPESNKPYRWVDGLGPDDVELAPIPERLLSLLLNKGRSGGHSRGDAPSSLRATVEPTVYSRSALEAECQAVRAARGPSADTGGERNATLNKAAFSLGQLVGGGELDAALVGEELLAAADACGLVSEDGHRAIEKTIRSGMDAGIKSPRNGSPKPPTEGEPPGRGAPTELRTDLGNARRFSRLFGRDFKYTAAHGWLEWDSRRWRRDDTGGAMRRAKATAQSLWGDVKQGTDPEKAKKTMKWALQSQGVARLKAILDLASSEPPIARRAEEFDRDPWLLTVNNGTIDLKTGELRPYRRGDLITSLSNISYNLKAGCPRFLAFLSEVFSGDTDLVEYLQRAVGYSLTGSTSEQVFFLLHGTGANGKSTLLEVLRVIFGDYAKHASFDTFLVQRNPGVRSDIARLVGARMVTATEGDAGRRLSESVIKSLTGGDTVTARKLYRDEFEYVPMFKVWLGTNHKPAIWGTDHALWRRVQLIPFNERFDGDRRNPDLKAELIRGASGILAWAVQGALEWGKRGLDSPEAVRVATEDYKQEEDVLGAFIGECCAIGPYFKARAADLFSAYEAWAKRNGAPEINRNKLGRLLRDRSESFTSARDRKGRWWKGIGLLASEGQDDD